MPVDPATSSCGSGPRFSVVIPTHNRRERLMQAIESVLSQSLADWELIIVDDASTDDTQRHLLDLSDPRILMIRNQRNLERSASRNRGIEMARGEYVAFLDSDDYYLPHHLQTLAEKVGQLDDGRVMLFTGAAKETDDGIRTLPDLDHRGFSNPGAYLFGKSMLTRPQDSQWVPASQFLVLPAVAVHRDILDRKQFDPRLNRSEDTELWLRIAHDHPIVGVREATVVVRDRPPGYAKSPEAKENLERRLEAITTRGTGFYTSRYASSTRRRVAISNARLKLSVWNSRYGSPAVGTYQATRALAGAPWNRPWMSAKTVVRSLMTLVSRRRPSSRDR